MNTRTLYYLFISHEDGEGSRKWLAFPFVYMISTKSEIQVCGTLI
jgi:hypothetical protein